MNLFRVVLTLYGCVYKILRLTNVKVAYSVVAVSVDYHSRIFQFQLVYSFYEIGVEKQR